MKLRRSHIIWISDNGTGKSRTFNISPIFLRVLSIVLLICICSVPLLEIKVYSLLQRTYDLEQKKQALKEKIYPLQYLKKALVRIEEKEKMFRKHFGMENFQSLDQIIGGGGELTIDLSGVNIGQDPIKQDMSLPLKLRTLASNYEIINKLTLKQKETWEKTPSIIPLAFGESRISSRFGWRKNPFTDSREFHAGIDIIGPSGTDIIAPASGIVIRKGYDQWLGNYLVLQHANEVRTIYGHLKKVTVEGKMRVKRGDVLGLLGNTGMSTSHHLHYTVIVNNRAVDPLQFILDMNG